MRYSPIPNEAQTITAELWTSAPSATIMLQVLSQANLRHPHKLLPYKQHLRLFAASCTRRAAHLLTDIRSRVAVQTAELFANGRASTSAMQTAYTNASSAIMEHAHTYSAFSLTQQTHFHPTGVNEQILHGAAVLHAAAAAATCCLAEPASTSLSIATACAKYTTRALYWEHLAIGADKIIISELMDGEEQRQAHILRLFVGNPFAPQTFPPMNLPSANSTAQEASCTQHYVNAA